MSEHTMSNDILDVEKEGGGGSQDALSIIRNTERYATEPYLVAVALSGPGGDAGRATDRMIKLTARHAAKEDYSDVFEEAKAQFTAIAEGVGNVSLAGTVINKIKEALDEGYGYEWIRMRPEFFIADVYAYVLGESGVETHIVNPVESIFMASNGQLDIPRTYAGLQQVLSPDVLNLVPGFAARRGDLTMANIGRGSTDLVGAAVSGALHQLYPDKRVRYVLRKDEVKGVMRVSPKVHEEAEVAGELSTGEVEALAFGGAEVVHPRVLNLIDATWRDGPGVDMFVRSTSDLSHPGTHIVPSRLRTLDPQRPVSGMASQQVTEFKWVDANADNIPGPVGSVGRVFAEHDLSITDVLTAPGGVIATFVGSMEASHHPELAAELETVDGASARVEIEGCQELVVIVGDALREPADYLGVINVLAQLATTSGVEIGSITHIKGEPTISFTLSKERATSFMRELYKRFFPN